MDDSKFEYFVRRTDQRLDEIDRKIDKILSFKFMILGGSAAISVLIHILFLAFEFKN